MDGGAVLLVSDNFLDMEAPSSSVDGKDLTNLTLDTVLDATGLDVYGISHSYWNRSGIVLGAELLAQWAAHHSSSDAAWSGEVSFSALSSLAGNTCMGLHVILVNK